MTSTSLAQPSARITEVTYCALPEDNINYPHYGVKVSWRGGNTYAVTNLMGDCLGTNGEWDYEPRPSDRDDGWLATHRFTYAEACQLAA